MALVGRCGRIFATGLRGTDCLIAGVGEAAVDNNTTWPAAHGGDGRPGLPGLAPGTAACSEGQGEAHALRFQKTPDFHQV